MTGAAAPPSAVCDHARVHRRGGRNWRVAALATLALLSLVAALAPATAIADPPILSVQVGADPVGRAMPPGFLGLSFEYKATHVYTGRNPDAVNPVLVALLRGLNPGQPTNIRIGGNSSDQTWWPIRGMVPPGGINYKLTHGWLRTTKTLITALHGQLILGVNLAANRPAIAAAEARALLAGIGRQNLQAVEIGNEADLYNTFAWYRDRRGRVVFSRPISYNLTSLIGEFARWRAAMPRAPIAGPSLAMLSWLGGFLSAEPRLTVATFHRYPLRACLGDPTSPLFASIPNLLADPASAGLAAPLAPYVQQAHAEHIPFRLDELNSASCSGKRGVSDAFASALWGLDTLFSMAAVGVDGVNFHTLPGAAYEPFTFTHHGSSWRATVHPLYYGALVFSRAFPPGAHLLPVTAPAGAVKVWATQAPDGKLRVVIINKSPDTPVQVQLQLPGTAGAAVLQSLTAPSLSATGGVSFAGQTFGSQTRTGVLPGTSGATPIDPTAGTYNVDVPAASAIVLTR
jgi:Glycosyl hydrolase family 79 C-terminal beta domain